MFLGNPSLPISIDGGKARESVEAAISQRNWKEFSVNLAKLILVPYYFFEYSTYTEEEKGSEKIVAGVERGRLVFNPETSEVVEGISDSMPKEGEMIHSIENIEELEVRKTGLEGGKAEKLCQLKTAEKLGKPLNKIIVENTSLFYVPLWELNAEIDGQEIVLHVGAADGSILEEEKLPFREKTATELAKEAFEELKSPKAWLAYSRELLELAAKKRSKPKGAGLTAHYIGKNWLWILILGLAVILIAVIFLM